MVLKSNVSLTQEKENTLYSVALRPVNFFKKMLTTLTFQLAFGVLVVTLSFSS